MALAILPPNKSKNCNLESLLEYFIFEFSETGLLSSNEIVRDQAIKKGLRVNPQPLIN